jgi:hypothetical protein
MTLFAESGGQEIDLIHCPYQLELLERDGAYEFDGVRYVFLRQELVEDLVGSRVRVLAEVLDAGGRMARRRSS